MQALAMRRSWLPLISVCLLAAGCTSTKASTTTAAQPVTTAGANSTPTNANTPNSANVTTPDKSIAQPASITPEVLCVTRFDTSSPDPANASKIYFGYTSSATTAVTIAAGADNALAGVDVTDAALMPTVFVPGHISPAFWAVPPGNGDQSIPSWTLKGPDGKSVTVGATTSTPQCTDALLNASNDTRTPDVAFSYKTLPENEPATEVDLFVAVLGVPDVSLCAVGFTPQPAIVWTEDGNGESQVIGSTVHRKVQLIQVTGAGTAETHLSGQTSVSVGVADACSADGTVLKSWPIGRSFERLRDGILVCFSSVEGKVAMTLQDEPASCDLPLTGGVKIRSTPP